MGPLVNGASLTDARLRELERSWQASGSVEDEAAWLLERVRAGALTHDQLERARPFSEAARLTWAHLREQERVKGGKRGRRGRTTRTEKERDAPPRRSFAWPLRDLDDSTCVRLGVAAVIVALERSTSPAQRLTRAVLEGGALPSLIAAVDDPTPEQLQRVREGRPRLDDQLAQTARFAANAVLNGKWEQGDLDEDEWHSVVQALRIGAKVAAEAEGPFLGLVDAVVARWILRGSTSLLAR